MKPGPNWIAEMTAKAEEAADHLLGSCEALYVHYEEFQNDQTFCDVLDSRVMECETCGWWAESCEIDDDGNCSDCQDHDEDD